MAFVDEVSVGSEPGLGGMLSSVGGMLAGLNPVLGIAGGLSGMFGGSGSGMDVSKAVSGGTFTTGEFGIGKSETTLIIIAAIVLGLFFIFKGKK